jgi:MftR C-terminal domain
VITDHDAAWCSSTSTAVSSPRGSPRIHGAAPGPPHRPRAHHLGHYVDQQRQGDDLAADEQFLLARLRLMISTPALRAKHLDNHYALQHSIVGALGHDSTDPDAAFHAQAAASACLAAMQTALVRWAEDDGRTARPDLIKNALAAAFGDDFGDDLGDTRQEP